MTDRQNSQPSDSKTDEERVDLGSAATSAQPGDDIHRSDPGSIGPYHLLTKLGEAGMGQVWLAEQCSPVKRQVALKLIKGGRFNESILWRFDTERQSLATMNHPFIAKVFDAGTTDDGQPYFVMEYVPGPPITYYCNQKHLNARERIELFLKICQGVQHAHQKAILHRDLKPSNILVAEIDGVPIPRITDFGIAKAMQSAGSGGEETSFTQAGIMVGTRGCKKPWSMVLLTPISCMPRIGNRCWETRASRRCWLKSTKRTPRPSSARRIIQEDDTVDRRVDVWRLERYCDLGRIARATCISVVAPSGPFNRSRQSLPSIAPGPCRSRDDLLK